MFSRRRNSNRKKKIKLSRDLLYFPVFILFLFLFFYLISINIKYYINEKKFGEETSYIYESNIDTIFSIKKIVLYSSADFIDTKSSKGPYWNLDLYQYTDIAIYIDNFKDNLLTSKNTIKDLYINNISYPIIPSKGEPSIYYKDINDFAKFSLIEENKIENDLKFKIIQPGDNLDFSSPTLYSTVNNPISLSYINKVKESSIIPSNNKLYHNGNILKLGSITTNSIQTTISFNINIINNLDELFICNVCIDIPLESSDKKIYDDNIQLEINNPDLYKFYKVNKGDK